MDTPVVSVILPVYNGAPYLREAIESILNQTYGNYEFIIINDGSTDNSLSIIQDYSDDLRLRVITQLNQGLASTLNNGILLSKGKYIARQDQDDISSPDRLEKQVKYLVDNPSIGMIGTWARIMEEDIISERVHRHPVDPDIIKFDLLFDNPFVHSSVMIRKEVLDDVGLYSTDPSRQPPEDYELWSRIARRYGVANIPEILLTYREVKKSMSRDGVNPFLERVIKISQENLEWIIGENSNQYPEIRDISILYHNAQNRWSVREKIHAIESKYNQIVNMFFTTHCNHRSEIMRSADNYLRNIKLNYFQSKYGMMVGTFLWKVDQFFKSGFLEN